MSRVVHCCVASNHDGGKFWLFSHSFARSHFRPYATLCITNELSVPHTQDPKSLKQMSGNGTRGKSFLFLQMIVRFPLAFFLSLAKFSSVRMYPCVCISLPSWDMQASCIVIYGSHALPDGGFFCVLQMICPFLIDPSCVKWGEMTMARLSISEMRTTKERIFSIRSRLFPLFAWEEIISGKIWKYVFRPNESPFVRREASELFIELPKLSIFHAKELGWKERRADLGTSKIDFSIFKSIPSLQRRTRTSVYTFSRSRLRSPNLWTHISQKGDLDFAQIGSWAWAPISYPTRRRNGN